MTEQAREALRSLRNATYRLAGNTSYEGLVSQMFDGIDTLDRELRRCRAETLREAAHVFMYRDTFRKAYKEIQRMADEAEHEAADG